VLGQGVGRAIALRLADDGFDVAVNDIVVGELESLVEEIKSKGRQSSIHIADVSMEDAVKKMVEDVVKEHGGLDIVSQSIISGGGLPIFTHFTFGTDGRECRYREAENND
jgi:short-subunit dehydrogenase involved in D-alanine esterification of teichoic acids